MADNSLVNIAQAAMGGTLDSSHDPLPMLEDEASGTVFLDDEGNTTEETTEVKTEEEAKPVEQTTAVADPIIIKDAEGKSYKVKLDVSDKKQVQSVVQQAYKAKALQEQVQELSKSAERAKELEADFQQVQSLLSEKGLPGVVDYLLDKDGGFEEFIEAERQRRNLLDSSNPEERDAALKEYELEKRDRAISAKEQKLNSQEANANQQAAQAAADRVQSMYNSSWSKHSFDGKLGDAEVEGMFNLGVHNAITAEIEAQTKAGARLTPNEVDSIVGKAFAKAQKALNLSVDKQAKQQTQSAKLEASKALDSRVAPPPQGSTPQSQALDNYKQGKSGIRDIVSAFLGRK